MERIFDFFDELPNLIKRIPDIIIKHYNKIMLVINVLGFLITLLCFFSIILSVLFVIVFYSILFTIHAAGIFSPIIILTVLLVLNLIAGAAVERNKPVLGILFSLLCGSAGGFIAAHTTNKNYSRTKIINLIFNAHIWIIIGVIVSSLLWWFGYYNI